MNYVQMTFAYMPRVNALGTDCCIIQHMHVVLSSRYVANFSQYRAPCVDDPQLAISINQSKRKTSNANGQTNLGHKHKAPDHNHEATQPMVDLPHTS